MCQEIRRLRFYCAEWMTYVNSYMPYLVGIVCTSLNGDFFHFLNEKFPLSKNFKRWVQKCCFFSSLQNLKQDLEALSWNTFTHIHSHTRTYILSNTPRIQTDRHTHTFKDTSHTRTFTHAYVWQHHTHTHTHTLQCNKLHLQLKPVWLIPNFFLLQSTSYFAMTSMPGHRATFCRGNLSRAISGDRFPFTSHQVVLNWSLKSDDSPPPPLPAHQTSPGPLDSLPPSRTGSCPCGSLSTRFLLQVSVELTHERMLRARPRWWINGNDDKSPEHSHTIKLNTSQA